MALTVVTDFRRISFSIGDAISAALDNFSKERGRIEAKKEADFQTAVANNSLSPDAQVAYRKQMLDDAKAMPVPDEDYITGLETKLASTKTMARLTDITTKINQNKANAAAGLESNQQYLEQLQSMVAGENDPTMLGHIQDEITNVQSEILSAKIQLIQSEASKGTTDKSTIELTKALNDAQSQKAQALAVGDSARAASMDVVISGVNQQLVNIRIDTENNGLNINKSTQGNPLGYLQQLQHLVATSDATTPIEYQGVGSYRVIAYASEQAYWQSVLGNYLNTTFVKDLTDQYIGYVNNAAVVNKLIPQSVLDHVKSDMAQLMANPVLAPYATQIQQVGTQVMGDAVAKNAAAIVDDYKVDNDANKAIGELNTLSSKYGIDVTSWTNQVVAGAAKSTTAQIGAFQASVNNYIIQGMTFEQAVQQANKDLQSGKGGAVPQSAKQLATENASQAVNPSPAQIKNAVSNPPISSPINTNENPTAAQLANEPAQSPGVANQITQPASSSSTPTSSGGGLQMPSYNFTSYIKTANNPTVYGVDASGQHVAFESMDQLNQVAGQNPTIQTVKSAPTSSVNFSQYQPLSTNNPATNPGQ